MKPDFLIAGFPRTGSSQIWHYLGQHPQVRLGKQDLHFFRSPTVYAKGWDWYQSQFIENKFLQGEATVHYFYPYCINSIMKHCPDTKLIFTLRNPVDRAYSHYWQRVRASRTRSSFAKAILVGGRNLEDKTTQNIFQTGVYTLWVRNILAMLPNRPLFIVSENARNEDPPYQETMSKVHAHLGLPDRTITPSDYTHKNKHYLKYPWLRKLRGVQRIVDRLPCFWQDKEPKRNPMQEKLLGLAYWKSILDLEKLLPECNLEPWKVSILCK